MKVLGSSMQSFGKSFTRHVSLPLAAGGAVAVKMAVDFNDSMVKISTQAGASQKEVKNLSKEVLNLAASGKSASSPNELAKALFHIESTGYRGARAMKVLVASEKLAAVGGSDLETTTNALIGVQQTHIKGTKTLAQTQGTLNAIVGAGNLRMDDLASSMSSGVMVTAQGLGVSLKDVGAALGVMTSRGIATNVSMQALNMGMLRMATLTPQGAKAMKSIGLSSLELATTFREKGLVAGFDLLAKHLDSISKTKANQVLTDAFGIRSAKAIRTVVGNVGDLHTRLERITKTAGNFQQKWHETTQTPAFRMHAELNKLQAVMIKLGNKLLPVVIPLLEQIGNAIKDIIDKFNALPKWTQGWIIKLGIAAVAFGPILSALGSVIKLAGTARLALGGMGAAGGAGAAAGGAAGGGALATAGLIAVPAAIATVGISKSIPGIKRQFSGDPTPGEQKVANVFLDAAIKKHHQLAEAVLKGDIPAVQALAQKYRNVGEASNSALEPAAKAFKRIGSQAKDAAKAMTLGETIANELANNKGNVAATITAYGDQFKRLPLLQQKVAMQQTAIEGKKWVRLGQITQNQLNHMLGAEQNAHEKSLNRWRLWGGDVVGTVTNAKTGAVSGVRAIVGDLNAALQAMGVKPVTFSIAGLVKTLPKTAKGLPTGKHAPGKQQGGAVVPGMSAGDKVPLHIGGQLAAMVEAGEYVSVANRNATNALMQANAAVPRFAEGGGLGKLGQAGLDKVHGAAQKYFNQHRPKVTGGLPGGGVSVGPIQKMAKQMVAQIFGKGQWGAFNALEMQEAGWNPRALNPSSGAAGLAQALPASKYPPGAWPYSGPKSAKLQLQWMMSYIKERYGSPAGAWAHEQANNWYQKGGVVGMQGGGIVPAVSGIIGGMHKRFPGLSVTSTTGGNHVPGSYHYQGKAVDLAGGTSLMDHAAEWVKSGGLYKALLEGIHNPNLAVSNGKIYSGAGPFGAVWAGHTDHIHLASDNLGGVNRAFAGGKAAGTTKISPAAKRKAKHAKAKSALDAFMKKGKALGLTPGIQKRVDSLTAEIAQLEEYAGNANSIGGPFRGQTEIQYLQEELHKLLVLRNTFASVITIMQSTRERLGRQLARMHDELKRLKGIKSPSNAQKDKMAALRNEIPNAAKAFTDLGGTIGSTSELLTGLQGAGGGIAPVASIDTIGQFGGQILQTQLAIRDAGGDATATDSSAQTELLQQLLREANQRTAVSQAQYDVFKNFPPFGGSFATGGIVPGPIGQPMMIQAHGGETVTPPGSAIRVEVHDHRIKVFHNEKEIEAIVKKVGRQQARGVGRTPGSAGSLRG